MKYANHPRDLNQRAKSIVDLSTGEKQPDPLPAPAPEPQKNKRARAKTLPAKRREQTRHAATLKGL